MTVAIQVFANLQSDFWGGRLQIHLLSICKDMKLALIQVLHLQITYHFKRDGEKHNSITSPDYKETSKIDSCKDVESVVLKGCQIENNENKMDEV